VAGGRAGQLAAGQTDAAGALPLRGAALILQTPSPAKLERGSLVGHERQPARKEKDAMIRKTILMVVVLAVMGSTARAQDSRAEVSVTAGWTFSDGVSGGPVVVPGIGSFDRVDPKDAFSWGARIGFLLNENSEIGFLFNQQSTKLEISGSGTLEIGDESIYNYHGYYAYNFGDQDATARPYLLIGLGATQYGALTASAGDSSRSIDGTTKFSGSAAVGLKAFPSPKLGIRLEGRWTPTYIKSDAAGWWCDPYWGCYVVGNAQYANQFELSGGIILRF
jgi:hypothetical protein